MFFETTRLFVLIDKTLIGTKKLMDLVSYIIRTFLDLPKQFRISYLPPLLVYLAAGISGLTAIVGTFFIKDYLDLSAAFLAGLGFWAGLPWALKMPLGHLVDLIWKNKNYMVFLGASIIAASLLIMHALIAHTESMAAILPVETWYVISVILAPIGFVVQDVVADAMTVEAVPTHDDNGKLISNDEIKSMHTTMQTLGRFAIISGSMLVALINVVIFSGTDTLNEEQRIELYAEVYVYALIIPLVSVLGVFLANFLAYREEKAFFQLGIDVSKNKFQKRKSTEINWSILLGSLAFVIFSVGIGLSNILFSQEIVFGGSALIILFLMKRLLKYMSDSQRNTIIGTATIIFVFRAMPSPGPGMTWFEIDKLLFDEQFFSILSLLASGLTLVGIVILRPFMANNSIATIVVVLSLIGAFLFLPSIGMVYGFHLWTSEITGGFVDARFIAIINTALESPLGQVAMIPLLAWIAKNAPENMKATFFAVFASFTNLALSASALGTKYLNQIFVITREVKDKVTGNIVSSADYSELGILMICVALVTLFIPIATIFIVQNSKYKSVE